VLTPTHVMLFGLGLFGIGILGVLTRRNAIVVLMSIELILNAANLNFVAVSWMLPDVAGQVLAVFVICVAAAEAAVGLALLIALYRNRPTVHVDDLSLLKG
jgi:NADH-quinone oxidoreductase subunit K